MAVYLITGKLGTGKSKACVARIREALLAGKKVATNIDLDLGKLLGPSSKATYIRLPDKPTAIDLACLPPGNESYDEDLNGVIVLDELGSWLNSRTFHDPARMPVLDWLIHSRKRGWDCYFICQDIQQVDKQFRESIVEFVGRCSRFDKMFIPVIGRPLNSLFGGKVGKLPRFHMCAVRMSANPSGLMADRWWYRGEDLHGAYDTRQIFRTDYPHGTHTILAPAHYGAPPKPAAHWLVRLFRPAPKPRLGARKACPAPSPARAALMKLPPDERIRVFKALQRSGVV